MTSPLPRVVGSTTNPLPTHFGDTMIRSVRPLKVLGAAVALVASLALVDLRSPALAASPARAQASVQTSDSTTQLRAQIIRREFGLRSDTPYVAAVNHSGKLWARTPRHSPDCVRDRRRQPPRSNHPFPTCGNDSVDQAPRLRRVMDRPTTRRYNRCSRYRGIARLRGPSIYSPGLPASVHAREQHPRSVGQDSGFRGQ